MAFVKPLNLLYRTMKSTVSVDKKGLCLFLQSDGYLDLCAAGERPYGIAYMTTEDPFNEGTYLDGQEIAVIREGKVILQLPDSHAAVAIGDQLCTTADGEVIKFVQTAYAGSYAAANAELIKTEQLSIVAIAEEAVAQNTGGEIEALLTLKG